MNVIGSDHPGACLRKTTSLKVLALCLMTLAALWLSTFAADQPPAANPAGPPPEVPMPATAPAAITSPLSASKAWRKWFLELRMRCAAKGYQPSWEGEGYVVQHRFDDGIAAWLGEDFMNQVRRQAGDRRLPMYQLYYNAAAAVNSWVVAGDTAVEQRLIQGRLARLGQDLDGFTALLTPLKERLRKLTDSGAGWQDPGWLDLYEDACLAQQRLEPLCGVGKIQESAEVLQRVFGDEYTPGKAQVGARLAKLDRQWQESSALMVQDNQQGKAALAELLAGYVGLRHDIRLGLKNVQDSLAAQKGVDLATEGADQWQILQQDIASPEWFAFVRPVSYTPAALVLPTDRDPAGVVLRRTAALLEEIQTLTEPAQRSNLKAASERLERLQAASEQINPRLLDARMALYFEACYLRRQIAFSNPLLNFNRILFIARDCASLYTRAHQQFFGKYRSQAVYSEGALLTLEDAFSNSPAIKNLMANAVCGNGRFKGQAVHGDFLTPELTYDGKSVLFSVSPLVKTPITTITADNAHHVFRMNLDGTELRQLTDGPYEDFAASPLPDGDNVFVSTRRGGYTMGDTSGFTNVFTLFRMRPDGSGIICLSPHIDHEWDPAVDQNGAILYTRWDIWDRGYTSAWGLWTTTPDGRDERAVVANYRSPLNSFMLRTPNAPQQIVNARPVPNSNLVMATAISYFDPSYGSIILIDRSRPDNNVHSALRRLAPDQLFPSMECGRNIGPVNYATPWPLSDKFFLCVYDGHSRVDKGPKNNFGLYLVDAFGNRELLYRSPGISCLSPMPVQPRPRPPVIPTLCRLDAMPQTDGRPTVVSQTDGRPGSAPELRHDASNTPPGTVCVVNVRDSLMELPLPVKRLRIVQALPKTTEPFEKPAMGYGSNKGGRIVLGTVPIEPDGSIYFEMPPQALNVPVYFQALDEDGLAVQTMRSLTTVKPGEHLTCLGCHEPRMRAPALRTAYPLALRRAPSQLTPDITGRDPVTFPRLVQPVLDKYCISCHGEKPRAEPSLVAGNWQGRPNLFYDSYINLEKYVQCFKSHEGTPSQTTPGKFGARVSPLYTMLKAGHHDVKLLPEDLYRIVLWIDLNARFFGVYHDLEKQARGQAVPPVLQ